MVSEKNHIGRENTSKGTVSTDGRILRCPTSQRFFGASSPKNRVTSARFPQCSALKSENVAMVASSRGCSARTCPFLPHRATPHALTHV